MVTLRNYIYSPIIQPVIQPAVTVLFAREQIKVDFPDDNNLVAQYIKDAQAILERSLNVAYTTRTLTVSFQHDGCHALQLPYGPVQSIITVKYKECECPGVAPTETTDYCMNGDRFKGCLGYYTVTYNTGMTEDNNDGYITALLQQIAWMYENRGDEKQPAINPNIQGISGAISRNSWI